jgi:ribosomal-protein-alanine N-acetyltransferase
VAARVEIRPFLRRDLDRILEIEKACFARHAYPRDLFLELWKEAGGLFFVARRSRRIAGYCVSSAGGSEAEVISLAVAPEHRAVGVATALLERTLTSLRRRRIATVALTVRPTNADAIRLYRRLGFRPAGKIPRYYEDRSDALVMRKRLLPA